MARGYKQPPLAPDETVVHTATGARLVGGRAGVGGQWYVTDKSLAFAPIDTDNARRALLVGAWATGVPGAGIANRALKRSELLEPVRVPLDQVDSISQVSGASLFSPPSVRVTTTTGESHDLGVTKGLWSPNWSRANSSSLNDLVGVLSGNALRLGQQRTRAKGCGTTAATLLLGLAAGIRLSRR